MYRVLIVLPDYIPSYLQPETRAALRVEMEKPISTKDEPGFIYCFELHDSKDPDHVHLKVGRAVSLNKRIDQWTKQCPSKEPVLRGWYPGPDGDNTQVSLLRGTVDPGKPGKHCHRLESKFDFCPFTHSG